MRVVDDDKAAIFLFDLLIHLHHFVLGEAQAVKLEIALILRELDVEPEDVHRVVVLAEILIAIHDHLCCVVLPLREVVSEGVKRWHWRIACQFRQLFLQVFGGFARSEHVEFECVALGEESGGKVTSVVRLIYKYKGFGGVHPSHRRVI